MFSCLQNQDHDYYHESDDNIPMDNTLPNNDGCFSESPQGGKFTYIFDILLMLGVLEDVYVHRCNKAPDPSDIECK